MAPAETEVLDILRSHANLLKWYEGKDGEWAEVMPEDARREFLVRDMKSDTSFDSILRVLVTNQLYREIDNEHGWVNMGEPPPASL
jgi:hypothetical protein